MTNERELTNEELLNCYWEMARAGVTNSEYRAELLRRLASAVPAGPRCPDCKSTDLKWNAPKMFCVGCQSQFLADVPIAFAQFFSSTAAPVAGKVEEVAHYAAIKIANKLNLKDITCWGIEEMLIEFLRPYFTSQPPAIKKAAQIVRRFKSVPYAAFVVDEYLEKIAIEIEALAAPVTPVSPTQPNKLIETCWTAVSKLESQVCRDKTLPLVYAQIVTEAFDALRQMEELLAVALVSGNGTEPAKCYSHGNIDCAICERLSAQPTPKGTEAK